MSAIRKMTLVSAATALAITLLTGVLSPVVAAPTPGSSAKFDWTDTNLGCVDDEVDEPGTDGRALVRVRVTNVGEKTIYITQADWRLSHFGVQDDVASYVEIASGKLLEATVSMNAPMALPPGATLEDVVVAPGNTGPAVFNHRLLGGVDGETWGFNHGGHVYVDNTCPQPGEPLAEATPGGPNVSDPEAREAANADRSSAVEASTRPRFTG